MKVTNLKRIVKEDFTKDNQALIEKLSFIINPMIEQLVSVLDHNIDFDNLNQQFIQVTTTVGGDGAPTPQLEIKYTLKSKLKGIICTSAQNTTDATLLTGAPFLAYTTDGSIIKISQITGLAANKKYNLSLILIG